MWFVIKITVASPLRIGRRGHEWQQEKQLGSPEDNIKKF